MKTYVKTKQRTHFAPACYVCGGSGLMDDRDPCSSGDECTDCFGTGSMVADIMLGRGDTTEVVDDKGFTYEMKGILSSHQSMVVEVAGHRYIQSDGMATDEFIKLRAL